MKKGLTIVLSMMLAFCLLACSNSTAPQDQEISETASETAEETEKEETVTQEEDAVDDPAWDTLNSLGNVKTENGLLYVYITLPAELVGEDVTQERLEAGVGDTFTSVTLNEDGSVTYKMTKKQHKAMLEELSKSFDDAFDDITASGEYAISEIRHNADYTSFDITLTTEELGLQEGFMVMAFYMYGGMYSIFTGKEPNITVNYYSAGGNLIQTANSADADF